MRNALVTGASRGLGKATAIALAAKGWRVGLVARTKEDLDAVAAEIRADGGEAAPYVADLTQADECARAVRTFLNDFVSLDLLVNNAGRGIYGPVEECSDEDFDALMAANVKSVVFCSQAAFAHMRQRGQGLILNVSSIAGKIGLPGESLYCASKFAVVGFTEALAAEAKPHGVKVTAFCPGGIDTPFWDPVTHDKPDVSTFLRPEDVAAMIAAIAEMPAEFDVPEITMRPMRDRH